MDEVQGLDRRSHGDHRQGARTLPRWKKIVFALLTTVAVFIAIELLLMLLQVRPILAQQDPFVGFESSIPLYVEQRIEARRRLQGEQP